MDQAGMDQAGMDQAGMDQASGRRENQDDPDR